jgi:predicted transcriptional regulator
MGATVGYPAHMRLHVTLDDDLVVRLDRRVGERGRSRFIAAAVARALEDDERWDLIESGIGSIADHGHDWDADPGAWVRDQRRADDRRVG